MFGLPRRDDDVGAEAGELRRNRFPEAGSATGDEHACALEGAGRQGAGPDRWRGRQAGEITSRPPVVRFAFLGSGSAELGEVL